MVEIDDLKIIYHYYARIAGASEATINILYDQLCESYDGPHRHYHIMKHLAHMFTEFFKHQEHFLDEAAKVAMAIFYHDYIYNAQPGDDEIASKEIARSDLSILGFGKTFIDRVCQLIDYTRTHDAPEDDFVARLFLDIDMSILATPRDTYITYADNVRREFIRFDASTFYRARSEKFLTPCLKKRRYF